MTVATIGKIRHAFLVKDRSIKRIARELHLARITVCGIVGGEETERHYVRRRLPARHLHGGQF